MKHFEIDRLYRLPEKAALYHRLFSYFLIFNTMKTLKNHTIREAAEKWIGGFSSVPGPFIEKLVKYDKAVSYYDSDSFRLIASPYIECAYCKTCFDGNQSLAELKTAQSQGKGIACQYCNDNKGDDWTTGYPRYEFPCGWGTLFAPKDSSDIRWFSENAHEVAKLGFHVFESEDWDILLGIDAGGFDFYEAFWIPLYKLRGLKWHELN